MLTLIFINIGCKKDKKDYFKPVAMVISILPEKAMYADSRKNGYVLHVGYGAVLTKDITIHVTLARTGGRPDDVRTIVIPAGHDNYRFGIDASFTGNTFEVALGEGYVTGKPKDELVECEDKTIRFGTYGRDGFMTALYFDYTTSIYKFESQTAIDYDGAIAIMNFNKATNRYTFQCSVDMQATSVPSEYPLYAGQKIQVPYFYFFDLRRNVGTYIKDDGILPAPVSAMEFTITRVGTGDFDAIFSGKVWSKEDRDSVGITNGMLYSAKLPVVK